MNPLSLIYQWLIPCPYLPFSPDLQATLQCFQQSAPPVSLPIAPSEHALLDIFPTLLLLVSAFTLGLLVGRLSLQRRIARMGRANVAIRANSSASDTPETSPLIPEVTAPPAQASIIVAQATHAAPEWFVVGASEIGQGHVKNEMPCQDSHSVRDLGAGWGVAVVCDGAGSRKRSHEGARFVAERGSELFAHAVKRFGWQERGELPSADTWKQVSHQALNALRGGIRQLAQECNVAPGDFGCTVIAMIFSPLGLCVAHIGDGRAGYRNRHNEWHAAITPAKGEEANETYFLTSDDVWLHSDELIETRVIHEMPTAFVLLTDGCEQSAFKCGYFDEQRQRFIPQNEPHAAFFDPILATLGHMRCDGVPRDQINRHWKKFLMDGTPRLRDESDDKTIVIGMNIG